MIKSLEPIFHQINAILSKIDGDNILSKLTKLFVIVQTEINKLPEDCPFMDACREQIESEYEYEPEAPIDVRGELD